MQDEVRLNATAYPARWRELTGPVPDAVELVFVSSLFSSGDPIDIQLASSDLDQLPIERRPRHIAVIMDGNGRWAKKRNLPRIAGHKAGRESVRVTVRTCARLGIPALSLYTFSLENWQVIIDRIAARETPAAG